MIVKLKTKNLQNRSDNFFFQTSKNKNYKNETYKNIKPYQNKTWQK